MQAALTSRIEKFGAASVGLPPIPAPEATFLLRPQALLRSGALSFGLPGHADLATDKLPPGKSGTPCAEDET